MPQASLFETTEVIWRSDKKADWTTSKVKDLPTSEIYVLSWNGRSFVQTEATLDSVDYAERYVKIQLDSGKKFAVGVGQLVPVVGLSSIDQRVSSVLSSGLSLVKASELKPGDRIFSVDDKGLTRTPAGVVGKANPGTCTVVKAKVRSCEPSRFYNLRVPVFNSVALDSGVFVATM